MLTHICDECLFSSRWKVKPVNVMTITSYHMLWKITTLCGIHKVFARTRCIAVFFVVQHQYFLYIIVGRKTFPRARRTQGNSFRSPVSFSPTDHSLSTSSGSSVFTPEYEDNRMRRRGSDIDNPTLSVMDISPPSRCKLRHFVNSTVKLFTFQVYHVKTKRVIKIHAIE